MTTPTPPNSAAQNSFGMQVLKTWKQVTEARAVLQSRGLSLTEGVPVPGGMRAVGDPKKSWDVLATATLIEQRYPRSAAILDLGANNSEILGILYRIGYRNLAGIDMDPRLRTMPFADAIDYRIGDYHASDFADGSFDVITAISVIEHGFNGPRLLAEVSRLLKPGGCFIASVDYWDPKLDTTGKQAYGMDWRIFSAGEIREVFRLAGEYGLRSPGSQDFAPQDKLIDWNDRSYTFAWLVLEKPAENERPAARPAAPSPAAGRKQRLALLSTFNQPCGIATHSAFILDALGPLLAECPNVAPQILVLAEDGCEHFDGDPAFVRRCWQRRGDDFSRARAVIEQEGVTVLHIQFHGGLYAGSDIIPFVEDLTRRGVRVVATVHSMENYLPLTARLSRAADQVFVFLDQAIPRLVAFGADPGRLRLIPHGTPSGRSAQPLAQAKAAAGVPASIRLVTSFGFFRPHKGMAEIIMAIPEVLKAVPNLFVMFIGGGHRDDGNDDRYYRHCADLVQRLGIGAHVDFLRGFIPDAEVGRFLSASDAIVLNYQPHRNELSGAAALAISHGRPVVTTATQAFLPLLDCTLQLSDEMDLATALTLVLGNPTLAEHLGEQARRHAEANSYERVGGLLAEAYGFARQTGAPAGQPAGHPADTTAGSDLPAHPRIICQMRIKNEARWIKEVLDSIAGVAQGIVILDDGSTDGTPEICRAHPAVIDYRWQNEPLFDEVRDKNLLLKMALAQDPDWVLCLDGDEILENSAAERIRHAIRTCPPDVSVLDIEFLYMWDDLRHYRVDGKYHRLFHHRIFRVEGQDRGRLSFTPSAHGGNLHCESVPPNIRGRAMEIDVKVKHLGYMYAADRQRKYEWYKRTDPVHAARGYYEHLLDQPGQTILEWQERPFAPRAGAQAKQALKSGDYYAQARREIIRQVPASARRILDVGCGHGATGHILRSERGAEVIGLEIHAEVAEVARQNLSQVVVGDVESMALPFAEGSFDCIVLADVLEHMIDPWRAVAKLKPLLAPGGSMVASLPNIRNIGVIAKLIEGRWDYADQGILDRTHLRFFALNNVIEMFQQAGLQTNLRDVIRDPQFAGIDLSRMNQAETLDLGRLAIKDVTKADAAEFTAIQFVLTASNGPRRVVMPEGPPVVSIVIPVFNNWAYTRQCIESIFTVGDSLPFEVIVVDDASTDGTADRLDDLPFPVKLVRHEENRGFAVSCNDGTKTAEGLYVLFLNNDTIVLPGWMDNMVMAISGDHSIGLVGNLQIYPDDGSVQQAGIVCGADKMVYSIYAKQLPASHPAVRRPREFPFIAGSCILLERTFFLSLGGFDEAYMNSCEDIDLCLKVREAGRKVWYCPDSRIYHFESRTVSGHSKSGANYQLLLRRWGHRLERDDEGFYREDAPFFAAAT